VRRTGRDPQVSGEADPSTPAVHKAGSDAVAGSVPPNSEAVTSDRSTPARVRARTGVHAVDQRPGPRITSDFCPWASCCALTAPSTGHRWRCPEVIRPRRAGDGAIRASADEAVAVAVAVMAQPAGAAVGGTLDRGIRTTSELRSARSVRKQDSEAHMHENPASATAPLVERCRHCPHVVAEREVPGLRSSRRMKYGELGERPFVVTPQALMVRWLLVSGRAPDTGAGGS
jgi:hypothetical protein